MSNSRFVHWNSKCAHPPQHIFFTFSALENGWTFFFSLVSCLPTMCSRCRVKLKMEMYAFYVRQSDNNWRNDLTNVPAALRVPVHNVSGWGNVKCKLKMKFHLVACRCRPKLFIIFRFRNSCTSWYVCVCKCVRLPYMVSWCDFEWAGQMMDCHQLWH